MSGSVSTGMDSRKDSQADDEAEREERPIKRPRPNPNSTTTNAATTTTRGTAAAARPIDTHAVSLASGLTFNLSSDSSMSHTSRRDREQQQIAASTSTNETGSSLQRSSRMFVLRRSAGSRARRRVHLSSQQTDGDSLGDGWSGTYGIGSEDDTGSSGADDDERQSRTGRWKFQEET